MNILFLGDIVGRSGRNAVATYLPSLVEDHQLDFVVINGENSAGGFGITEEILQNTLDAGADVVTTGNHVWDQREALVFAERQERFLRPINYPSGTPGKGYGLYRSRNGADVLVCNVMGQLFMEPLSDPMSAIEELMEKFPLGQAVDFAIFDVHAEATSEKQSIGYFLDGNATLVVGTHTHIPTADHRILPKGTAYMTDAGMCGCYDSVIGMDVEEPVRRMRERTPGSRLEAASGEGAISGLAVRADDATGLAIECEPIRKGAFISQAFPSFWEK